MKDNGLKILSLFDGMSCGYLALLNGEYDIECYHAYEVDKYAIKTSKYNFPNIIHHGDVFEGDFKQYKDFDILIGGSPCFTESHLVLTNKGYVDISQIRIGDMVLTHKNRFKPVTKLYTRQAETYSVKVMGYPEFVTTKNHPFYTIKREKCNYSEYKTSHSWRKFDKQANWTPVNKLTSDHFCSTHIALSNNTNEFDLDEETCWILGRYVADGSLKKKKRPKRKNSYQYQLHLAIGATKINQFKNTVTKRYYVCQKNGKNVYRCTFYSKDLVDFIIDNDFGRGAYNKKIPEFIYNLPDYLRISFLNGYLSGDGCYIQNSDEWAMSTISPQLAFGLQRLITSIYQTNCGVSIQDNDRVHYIDDRLIKANYPLYTIQFKKTLRKQSVAHIQDNKIWTQVKSVIKTGDIETVYNIEVADDNSYTVNNCIVHNCTYWSIAQSPDKRETTASGVGWELFSQYVRALREAKPKYFIYENNKSMSKAIRESITQTFGFEPICINSALVSAQNRQRLYWVGKRNADGTYSKVDIQQPEDRGILLRDVLDGADLTNCDKAYCLTSSYGRACAWNTIERHQRSMVAEPVDKSIRVGIYPTSEGRMLDSQGMRIYSIDGKSVTQSAQGGGMGAKTGLYAIPVEFDGNVPVKAVSGADGKAYTVYEVKNGSIAIKGKTYPIKLIDGYYIIRKLTVSECKRLQKVPEWFEFPVSNTQAYKLLGNGWTVDVITHILNSIFKNESGDYNDYK